MGRLRKWLSPTPTPSREVVVRPREAPAPTPAPEVDPDLAELHRALAAAEAEPIVSSDERLTALTLGVTVRWMHTAYEAGELDALWQCRMRYGYGAGRGDAAQADWYWFNAYPALAALKMGKRDHPFVATCSGLADQTCDRGDQRQREAQAAIESLFFQ